MARGIPLIALLLLGVSVLGGCGSSDKSDDPKAKTLAFKLTDEGCDPHNATVATPPGATKGGCIGESLFD